MKKFLLIGIGGVYNYGCEAIVRGTEHLLHKYCPDSEIIYASSRPDDDRKRLRGCAVEVIRRDQISRYSPRNLARKLLSYVGISYRPCIDRIHQAKDMDAVFSIGGDMYTLNGNNEYNANLVCYGNSLISRNIPYILWGASVGPFSDVPEIERVFAKHLSQITHIAARENATIHYLKSIGVSHNVSFLPDPAFVVSSDIIKTHLSNKPHKPVIGINLSPLSAKHLGISLDKAIIDQSRAITEISEALDAHIVLIPHVYCEFNENDDDLRYLQRIKANIPPSIRNRVTLIDNDPGFIGIKSYLIQCDVVFAARMHCAINSLTCHVPTLFLSYSQKSLGLCNLVYGNHDYVIPLSSFSSAIGIQITKRLLDEKDIILANMSKRVKQLQKSQLFSSALQTIQFSSFLVCILHFHALSGIS